MALKIFFDTNALYRADITNSTQFQRVAQYARRYQIPLITNWVVVTELANQRERDVLYIKWFYDAWNSVFKRQANIALDGLEFRGFSLDGDIVKPLTDAGVIIANNEAQDITLGIQALYKGAKPTKKQTEEARVKRVKREIDHDPGFPSYIEFDYKDHYIKDFFIWRSVLLIVKDQPDTELIFITKNHSDFCESDCDELHPELSSQFAEEESGSVIRLANFPDFIQRHVIFVEGFEVRALDVVRSDNSLAFTEDGRLRQVNEIVEVKIKNIIGLNSFYAYLILKSHLYESDEQGEIDESTQVEILEVLGAVIIRVADTNESEKLYSLSDVSFFKDIPEVAGQQSVNGA